MIEVKIAHLTNKICAEEAFRYKNNLGEGIAYSKQKKVYNLSYGKR